MTGRLRRGRRAVSTVLVLGLGGCTGVPTQPPGIEVVQVELGVEAFLDGPLAVLLCVTNPGDAELAFRRVSVGLDVAGAPLAAAETVSGVRVPARGSALVPVAAVVTAGNLGPQVLGIVRAGGIEYRVRGSVTLAGVVPLTVPFARSGRLGPAAVGSGLADAALAGGGGRCGGVAPAG